MKDQKTIDYYKNPKICICCKNSHSYERRNSAYCSNECKTASRKPKSKSKRQKSKSVIPIRSRNNPYTKIIFCMCRFCKIDFIWNSIERGLRHFCSRDCLHDHRSLQARNNPNLGVKRSKDEIKLFELGASYFQNVSNNESIVNGWDADIIIKDYKIAILWNGPWHYRDMHIGNHSLKQVQNRDKLKTKEFEQIGWTVLVFEDRYYTPETAFENILKMVPCRWLEHR